MINITIDDTGLKARIHGLEKRAVNALPFFRSTEMMMRRSIMLNFYRGGRPTKWKTSTSESKFGRKTMNITGRLKQSIVYTATPHQIIVSTNLRYARLQQYGGTIKPRNKKFLAVPIVRQAFNKRPKDFPDLVVIKSKKGGLILAKVKGEKVTPMFALLKSVTIPARKFILFQKEDVRDLKSSFLKYVIEGKL